VNDSDPSWPGDAPASPGGGAPDGAAEPADAEDASVVSSDAPRERSTSPPDSRWDGIVRAMERPFERFLGTFKWSLLAALLVLGWAFWLQHVLVDQQSLQMGRISEAKAAQLKSALALAIAEREQALGEMAYRWEHWRADPVGWSVDAALLIQRDLQFRGIAWLDDTLGVRWTRPTTATITRGALDRLDDPIREHAISLLDPTNRSVMSRTYILMNGQRQLMVRARLQGESRGMLIGVIRPGDLFDAVLVPEIRNGWAIAVYEGPYLLYGAQWATSGPEAQWTREAEVNAADWVVSIRVWPSEELAAEMRSPGPRAAMIGGVVIAFFVAIGVRRIETLSRRAA